MIMKIAESAYWDDIFRSLISYEQIDNFVGSVFCERVTLIHFFAVG